MDCLLFRKHGAKINPQNIEDLGCLIAGIIDKMALSNGDTMLLREKFAGLKKASITNILTTCSGQITIFFATTIVVMITLIAFIINIGIFVKAKINLQNATDAAAYAGASVQARQLSNIAYMNWEMRNVYKEWMFKYYVLGNLNLNGVINSGSSGPMDFRMQSSSDFSTQTVEDPYNFPSTCIDFAETGGVGLCTKFMIPGLPRFNSSNVIGMSAVTNAFIDTIVAEKNKDCASRSQLNFYTANTWAYNVTDTGDDSMRNLRDLAPEVAAGRMGAFPKAFDIALRIRNLEAQVNKPPVSGVCKDPSLNPSCSTGLADIINTEQTPSNERIFKAYMSASRNLGSEQDREMRDSFTLTEIAPTEFSEGDAFGMSNLLIPSSASFAMKKYFLDLKLMTVNLAPMYTMFTSNIGDIKINNVGTVASEGQCTATKMGLPVPGYPLGYVKNPDVVTYYAVKGEAQFVGLFNPFEQVPIQLTAFAAAKPFGGRIGPMLFSTNDSRTIFPREKRRSSPYISALDTANFKNQYGALIGPGVYAPGVPLPMNPSPGADSANFWLVEATQPIGGYAGGGQSTFFGIPNMAYDYPTGAYNERLAYTSENDDIQIISSIATTSQAGLFNSQVYNKLKSKLVGVGGTVTIQAIDDAILMARAPTALDANNYLIPTPEKINSALKADSFGVISSAPVRQLTDANGTSYDLYNHQIYAPVFGTSVDSIYRDSSAILEVLNQYLLVQEGAINKYVESMGIAAQKMFQTNKSENTDQDTAVEASKALSDIDFNGDVSGQKPSCSSIAGKFAWFYLGQSSGVTQNDQCPTPLNELLNARWNNFGFSANYNMEYVVPSDPESNKYLFSAYRTGEEKDGSNSGIQVNALSNRTEAMIRNFYSTKFISLKTLVSNQGGAFSTGLPIFTEGRQARDGSGSDTSQKNFANPINPGEVNLDLNKIKH